jgi:hypothetical protein
MPRLPANRALDRQRFGTSGSGLPSLANQATSQWTRGRNKGEWPVAPGALDHPVEAVLREWIYCRRSLLSARRANWLFDGTQGPAET